ncbi:thioredoxin [Leptospira interrogans serovar Grippotyphosa str. 2006006986]|uniref:DsbA family protein n=1 Tax=Leptospira interrogans TaxID=173 RepID=UPI000292720A|nr:DsbA family protein [Leptospira interrogans]EKO86677.1 thioredoxin [Leptospira interrogans serovar Grippotyphosa str. Andaman]EKP84135.1 thioredoxin [Leptospira interrogans serovar Grippotyphosa str. 2006006986]EMN78887.1 thioredoxin [Leptospira interrogans serovar Grippotyphosa str. UI 12764]EMO94236.1 thioredoxin [Leptospira interrogans str. UI 13372]
MNRNEPIRHSILYVTDPLCPWCYGFGSVMKRIKEKYENKIRFSLVLGGLRFEESAELLTPELARSLKHEWKDAEFTTKQSFSLGFLEKINFRYDSFLACKAVISVQKIKPEIAFEYLNVLSKSFYFENQDPTSFETFVKQSEKFGITVQEFQTVFEDTDTDLETRNDFYYGFSLGVSVFPSLVFSDGIENGILTRGYCTFEQVDFILKEYFRAAGI